MLRAGVWMAVVSAVVVGIRLLSQHSSADRECGIGLVLGVFLIVGRLEIFGRRFPSCSIPARRFSG